jgi:hypothetical protein
MADTRLAGAYVEVYAKVDKDLDAKFKELEKSVDGLNTEFEQLGAAGDKANPGLRKIEDALGRVSTRAAGLRGTVADVADSLLSFGPQGVAVLAALAGIAALIGKLQEYEEEVTNAEKASDDLANALFKIQRDLEQESDPVGFAARNLKSAQDEAGFRQQSYNRAKADLDAALGVAQTAQRAKDEAKALAELKTAQDALKISTIEYQRAVASGAKDAEAAVMTQYRAIKANEARAEAESRAATAIADARRRANEAARESVAGLTGTSGDQAVAGLARRLSDVNAQIDKVGATPDLLRFRDALEQSLFLAKQMREELERTLIVADSLPDTNISNLPDILRGANRSSAVAGPNNVGTSEFTALSTEADKAKESVVETAFLLGQAVDGALDLASAFGDVDAETQRVLSSVSSLAQGIATLVPSLATGNIGGIVSGALGIVGGLASAFAGNGGAQDAADLANVEALKDNQAALRELTQKIGDLGVQLTGLDFVGALGEIDRLLPFFERSGIGPNRTIAGLDQIDVLTRAAEAVGIAFVPTIEGLKDLREALIQSEINQYARTFSGSLQRLQDSIAILDIEDPVKRLAEAQRILSTQQTQVGTGLFGIPVFQQTNDNAIGRALAGADLTSPQGRQALEDVLRQLFAQSQTVDDGQFGAFFGDLSPAEFIDALTQITDLIDATQRDEGGQTVGFAQVRTITEVTGERLTALLGTANFYAERTAQATEATARNTAVMVSLLSDGVLSAAGIDQQLAARASDSARRAGNLVIS